MAVALLLDGPLGRWDGLEPRVRDRLPALDRETVRPGLQPLLGPPLQVHPHAIGVKLQALGEFGGPGGALELGQQRKQPCPRRLRERGFRQAS